MRVIIDSESFSKTVPVNLVLASIGTGKSKFEEKYSERSIRIRTPEELKEKLDNFDATKIYLITPTDEIVEVLKANEILPYVRVMLSVGQYLKIDTKPLDVYKEAHSLYNDWIADAMRDCFEKNVSMLICLEENETIEDAINFIYSEEITRQPVFNLN